MADALSVALDQPANPPRKRRVAPQLSMAGLCGLVLACAIIFVAIIGPFVAPHNPLAFLGLPFKAPSPGLLLGTDGLGRDVLSRVLCGGRSILVLSLTATLIGVLGGAMLGLTAAYAKGLTDQLVMRSLDGIMAFPQIILALLFVSIIGPQQWLIATIVAILHAPQVARVVRSATLRIVEEDYVRYAESIGVPTYWVIAREIMPNILPVLAVELGLRFTYSTGLIAGLSFLGLGTPPPDPDWGSMINENRLGLASNPWGVVAPIVFVAAVTIGTNLFVEALAGRRSKGSPNE